MLRSKPSSPAMQVIYQDANHRDLTVDRRETLLNILWHERYLTRAQLITRVEMRLGKNIFDRAIWKDNYFRDMRLVKQAFQAAGMQLAYSRNPHHPGYYLKGQPPLSAEYRQILRHSLAEVDPRQIDIYRQLSHAERFQQGCSISTTARKAVAYQVIQQNPGIDPAEANRMALARIYADNPQ
jgi:hypothetical protein